MDEFGLKIDDANLSIELATHAEKFAYEAEQAIGADLKHAEFSMKVDELYSMVDREVRARAEADGKKITEKVVENEVKASEQYKKAALHLLKLKAHRDIMKSRREAWKERGSMLVQMSAMKRAEMESIAFSEMKAA